MSNLFSGSIRFSHGFTSVKIREVSIWLKDQDLCLSLLSMAFRIRLAKENFKFSCSHFTIFSQDAAEALHGHNYYVSAEFGVTELDPRLGMAFDFNLLKPLVRELADRLDEKVLIPSNSPFLKIESKAESVRVSFGKKNYEFPASDVLLLDVVNITAEELARTFASEVASAIKKNARAELKKVTSVSIGIEETRGQTVFFDIGL